MVLKSNFTLAYLLILAYKYRLKYNISKYKTKMWLMDILNSFSRTNMLLSLKQICGPPNTWIIFRHFDLEGCCVQHLGWGQIQQTTSIQCKRVPEITNKICKCDFLCPLEKGVRPKTKLFYSIVFSFVSLIFLNNEPPRSDFWLLLYDMYLAIVIMNKECKMCIHIYMCLSLYISYHKKATYQKIEHIIIII